MKLSHYSIKPVDHVWSTEQSKEPAMKPHGFWVSVDGPDDWKAWCASEGWGLPRLKHRQAVTLSKDANVLILTTEVAVREFAKKYEGKLHPSLSSWQVDWFAVAKEHQGIIIAPYIWSLRLSDVSWYYGWDCASGCIWDAKAIETVSTLCSI